MGLPAIVMISGDMIEFNGTSEEPIKAAVADRSREIWTPETVIAEPAGRRVCDPRTKSGPEAAPLSMIPPMVMILGVEIDSSDTVVEPTTTAVAGPRGDPVCRIQLVQQHQELMSERR